jgi:hypothetical protein
LIYIRLSTATIEQHDSKPILHRFIKQLAFIDSLLE